MIEGLKPYQEYRQSRLSWLSRCPSHWREFRLDRLFDLRNERPQPGDERVTGYLSGRVTLRSNVVGQKIKGVIKDGGWKRIYPGDFAISGMNAHIGGMGVSDSLGKCSPIYLILVPRAGTNAHFVAHALRHVAHIGALKSYVNTIRFNSADFKRDALKLFRLPMPEVGEQAAIVRFLDHANCRFERFIRAKRRLIAFLNEQKRAIVHRAVTRGFDPDVCMKDSGVPWLGEIPAHWAVRKLKSCISTLEQGWSPQCDAQPAGLGEWAVLKVGCVNKDDFAPEQNKRLPPLLQPIPELEIRHGDILMSRANTRDLLGLAAVAEKPRQRLILCDKLFRFRAIEGCFVPKYLVHVLRALPTRVQIESRTNGASSSMQNIGQDVLRNLLVTMPPIAEQEQICSKIATATQGFVSSIRMAERELALLQEYRTRLIADVVTGQLDVREAAARLPASDPDEPAPADLEDDATDDDLDEGEPE